MTWIFILKENSQKRELKKFSEQVLLQICFKDLANPVSEYILTPTNKCSHKTKQKNQLFKRRIISKMCKSDSKKINPTLHN